MPSRQWTTERAIRAIAGTLVLGSLGLGLWVHSLWFAFTAFVGLNLFQSAFTRWCLMEKILMRFGMPPCEVAGAARSTSR